MVLALVLGCSWKEADSTSMESAHVAPDHPQALLRNAGDAFMETDSSQEGHSLGHITPTRQTIREPSTLTDPPMSMDVDSGTAAFIAGLATGDTTEYAYFARVEPTAPNDSMGEYVYDALDAGTLNNNADYQALQASWAADRQSSLASDLAVASAAVTTAGGTLLEVGEYTAQLSFLADEPTIQAILTAAPFLELRIAQKETLRHAPITGSELRLATRTYDYVNTGADIDGDGTPEVFDGSGDHIVIWDVEPMDNEDHPGFFSSPPTMSSTPYASGPRLGYSWGCNVRTWSTNCDVGVSDSNVTTDFHGTAVAGVALGDLNAGQDSSVVLADRPHLSYQAPGLQFDFYHHLQLDSYASEDVSRSDRAARSIIEHIVSSPRGYHFSNHSYGSDWDDCDGKKVSRDYDDLFDGGVLAVVSAGNTGSSTTLCRVHKPADAFSTLAVAGSEDGVRFQNPSVWHDGSSTAGPGDRSIIDIMAPAYIDGLYYYLNERTAPNTGYTEDGVTTIGQLYQWPQLSNGEYCNNLDDNFDGNVDEGFLDEDGDGLADICSESPVLRGTSLAAPSVAGALSVYRQFYTSKYSRLIDDPGIALVNVLVRGDGLGIRTPTTATGYSHDVGAGNLEMWMTNTPALTPSWGWGTGRVCVRDGERLFLPITDNMPWDPEGLRVVAWWQDTPSKRDLIDLAVYRDGMLLVTDTSDDVKKRVMIGGSSLSTGVPYEFALVGRDIRGNESGCDNKEQLVYWAYMYADEAGF